MVSSIRSVKSPQWELGVAHHFGKSGPGTGSLLSGWSEPEDEHVWTHGTEATQHIVVAPTDRPLTVSLECLPFIGGICLRQDVTLYVNGIRVKFWRLRTAEIHQLDATIPPHCFTKWGESMLLKCVWHLPCSISPRDAGTGGDARELGLCFRALTISQISAGSLSLAETTPA